MDASRARSMGIISSGRDVFRKRIHNAVTVLLPTLGAIVGVGLGIQPSPTAASLGVFLFIASGAGVGIGLHRYFSHHAFETGDAGRWILGALGTWAWQGPIEQWVADHRRHHRFADTPFDPHSPHWISQSPPPNVVAGLAHAHIGWMLYGDVSDVRRYAADIWNDPISRWFSRNYWPLAASTIALPALIGLCIGGVAEAVSCLVWAGFVRVALVQHFTWAIASFGHSFGAQVPESKDESRNSIALAVLLFGEGLHSYHHAHPSSGVNQPALFDLNGLILRVAERFGLVWNLKRS